MKLFTLACFLILLGTPSLRGADLGGLQISGAADLVADFGFKDADDDNRLKARTVEFMIYGPTDHLFEGNISFAAHLYQGEQTLELHEAYIKSSKLIPRSRFKIGQFFLGIGRLNDIHQHDWPFIHAPISQERFFDSEGIIDSGLQYSFLAPTPFFLDITAGVTNGWRITHSHGDDGEKPKVPTHYIKAELFNDLPFDGGLLWGLNYLSRKDSESRWLRLYGAHVVAKWRRAKTLRLFVQSEIWNRYQKPQGSPSENELAGYLFANYGWSPQIMTGLRFDAVSNLDLEDVAGQSVKNYEWQISPEATWAVSEFAKFRAGYSYRRRFQESVMKTNEHIISLQSVFILGAHPAHEF